MAGSIENEIVYAMDVEMIEGRFIGTSRNLAGRVVVVRNDPTLTWTKVLDTYVWQDPAIINSYKTRWSRLHPWMIQSGVDQEAVVSFILRLISGHKLVTFAGAGDLASLGLSPDVVDLYASERIELQDYFCRKDGRPYGLGPLVDHFGYKRIGQQVVIRHNCVDDAQYTLRLYLDHYQHGQIFSPESYIMTKKEYCRKYGIY